MAEGWDCNQLAALADAWLAEREDFLSALRAYLATTLPTVAPARRESLPPAVYHAEVEAIGVRLHRFLVTMDGTVWYTLLVGMAAYQRALEEQFGAAVRADAQRLAVLQPPDEAGNLHAAVRQALGLLQHILSTLKGLQGVFDFATLRHVRRVVSQMKYRLYPLRLHLSAFQRYWLYETSSLEACDPPAADLKRVSGIRHYDPDGRRGAYTLYIPEAYRPERPGGLILALHGANGSDEDFLWTWIKDAKSRGYLLVSAKSFGDTWYPWDAVSLMRILDEVGSHYQVDPKRVLLTGLSDGGSFCYDVGFAHPEPFAGLAVIAGVLRPHRRHPRASRLPVYIAHGTHDHLFPVTFIRRLAAQLQAWGHHVTYHEVAGFGHAYPPGENTAILDWFEGLTGPLT